MSQHARDTTDIPELRLHFIIFFAFLPKNSDHDDHVILEIRDLSILSSPKFRHIKILFAINDRNL